VSGGELRFGRLSDAAAPPRRAYAHDAGLDLCAAESASLGPGERVSVGTGLAVEIPEGSAGLVLPRSGLAARHGITIPNAPGLVDAGYRGELRVLLLNTDAEATFAVAVGDRIAQLVIVRVETLQPVEVSELAPSERAERGFGSSGVAGEAVR
jgi:dUTP pyrophosphatase